MDSVKDALTLASMAHETDRVEPKTNYLLGLLQLLDGNYSTAVGHFQLSLRGISDPSVVKELEHFKLVAACHAAEKQTAQQLQCHGVRSLFTLFCPSISLCWISSFNSQSFDVRIWAPIRLIEQSCGAANRKIRTTQRRTTAKQKYRVTHQILPAWKWPLLPTRTTSIRNPSIRLVSTKKNSSTLNFVCIAAI